MITSAIFLIKNQLNEYLVRSTRSDTVTEEKVVVSSIVEQDGSLAADLNERIVLSLINIEKDTVPYRQPQPGSIQSGISVKTNPPIYLNLYIMMAAFFKEYDEALKYLSRSIAYFQAQPTLNHINTPAMVDKGIEKITLDINNLTIQDISNLWGALGGKYRPSILYKVRLVAIDTQDITDQVPTVHQPEMSVTS